MSSSIVIISDFFHEITDSLNSITYMPELRTCVTCGHHTNTTLDIPKSKICFERKIVYNAHNDSNASLVQLLHQTAEEVVESLLSYQCLVFNVAMSKGVYDDTTGIINTSVLVTGYANITI